MKDPTIVGVSPWAGRMRDEIERVAPSDSTVLISGPTGTGKELVARAIHAQSARGDRAFVAVDCAAMGDGLFVSHMFGHRKGAFTGADHESVGCFRAAEGGTIFLDEVGELDLGLQAKLLRVLEERVVVPLGGHEGTPVDIRVIAATNRDLRDAIAAGQFREDLYYRLEVVLLTTTALRDRPEDIAALASYLLERSAAHDGLPLRRLTPEALKRLQAYHWPGNVRQLKNVLERAVLFGHEDPLNEDVILEMLSDQPGFVGEDRSVSAKAVSVQPVVFDPAHEQPWPTMAKLEREHLLRTLRHTGYNLSATARLLGWERNHLRRKAQKYGLDLPSTRPERRAAQEKGPSGREEEQRP